MKYLYNDNFEKEFKVAESEAEFKTLSYEEKGLCIDTFYSVMFGQCSPLSHSDCDPGSWYDLDLLDDLGYRTMDEQFNLSQAIDADEIKPLTDDDLLKMFNSALNKYRIFNRKNDGYMVQPQTKEELVDIIRDAIVTYGKEVDLNFIDTSKITDMSYLFASPFPPLFSSDYFSGYGFDNFNGNISKWDVSNVKDMSYMFLDNFEFNQPLNDWDVSHVTNMYCMFGDAESFNQPLDQWDVSNVTEMENMFCGAKNFNQPLDKWNVSNVKNMSRMFAYSSFNQPLDKWNVSNVTSMVGMFDHNKAFNQPLDKWNTKNLEDSALMFVGANSFNQNLSSWNSNKISDCRGMFKDAKNFDSEIPSFDNFEFSSFADKCKHLCLSDKYIEKHDTQSLRRVAKATKFCR